MKGEGGEFSSPLIELTMKSVVGGIVPSHGFDHERFDGFEHSSFIWGGIHFGEEGCWWTRRLFYNLACIGRMRKSESHADSFHVHTMLGIARLVVQWGKTSQLARCG